MFTKNFAFVDFGFCRCPTQLCMYVGRYLEGNIFCQKGLLKLYFIFECKKRLMMAKGRRGKAVWRNRRRRRGAKNGPFLLKGGKINIYLHRQQLQVVAVGTSIAHLTTGQVLRICKFNKRTFYCKTEKQMGSG